MPSQFGIQRLALCEEGLQVVGEWVGLGLIGDEAGGFVDIVVPMLGPGAVFRAGAGGPGEHCFVEGDRQLST